MAKRINVKIASDVVCPWCYIGKKNLAEAARLLGSDYQLDIQYLPFELAPEMPAEGRLFRDHITSRYGDWNTFIERGKMVEEVGAKVGIRFRIEELGRTPNTFQLHRVIQFAHQVGLQSEVKEALFKAYFEDLLDLTDQETVIKVVSAAGLDADHVRILLQGDEGVEELKTLEKNVVSLGIRGVPFFIINDTYGINGAVSPEQLVSAITEAAKDPAVQNAE